MSAFVTPGAIGQTIAVGCGVWLLLFPILWYRFVDKQLLNLKLFKNG